MSGRPWKSPAPRCKYRHADFFALARGDGFDPDAPGMRFDAVLLDIDHTPDHLLAPGHADFYTKDSAAQPHASGASAG